MPSRTILAPEEIAAFQEISSRDRGYANQLLRIYLREGATNEYLRSALNLTQKTLRRRVTGRR